MIRNKVGGLFGLVYLLLCVSSVWAADTPAAQRVAPVKACKLFPVLTDGIYNGDGKLVMNCQIAQDGLTVTDKAWLTYAPEGKGKRWNVNQNPYSDQPLVGYKFDDQFAGLQVNITVEIYNPANIYEVLETYQEILQLGGTPKLDLPEWFHCPQGRLSYDFDEENWFPSGWSLPKGKFACWEGAAKVEQKDRNGRTPMLDFGFTQVAENALTPGGSVPPWENQCRVFGDAEWLTIGDGFNIATWHNDGWKNRGKNMKIVIPDFENADHFNWTPAHYDAFRAMVLDFKKAQPKGLIGCWGVGVTRASLRIFDEIDDQGRPTGGLNLKACKQWRDMYDHPETQLNPLFTNTGLNFGQPAVYWMCGGNPAHLYAVVQEWEVGKLARPKEINVMSTWIQTEFVDGYPLSPYRFPVPGGSYQLRGIKHQAPPSFTYGMSLFSHCRMDGAYCWETGTMYSEDPADAGEQGEGGMQLPIWRKVNGVDKIVFYYIKYFGFYNYHVLGMWQASQNKEIIEAETEWLMPEIFTSNGNVWRTGDDRYPSFCNHYREPLVRLKKSLDGTRWLVIACNPYNTGVQQVKVRCPGEKEVVSFELIGDYPVIKQYKIKL